MTKPTPKIIQTLNNVQEVEISRVLKRMAGQLAQIARSVTSENQIREKETAISYHTSQAFSGIEDIIYSVSMGARKGAIEFQTKDFETIGFPKKAPKEFRVYLDESKLYINQDKNVFLNESSRFDGKSIRDRIITIKEGTEDTVGDILRIGVREGKSSQEVAAELENYITPDARRQWVSPWIIQRAAEGFPLDGVYTGDVAAGSVEYNATRIARTELINEYRYATIDSTRNKDWAIGWAWVLSLSHPVEDICNDWAVHDEGLGRGVYSNADEILGLGHPHCLCNVQTRTVFHNEMKPFFAAAYANLGKPIDKYVRV